MLYTLIGGRKIMKQLTDTERLEVAMSLLSERDVEIYAQRCKELELDCEYNGFYNVPAECENLECSECALNDHTRLGRDCPYMGCL
jgi:3-deoxy-D-manno-octulosonate 8-phosphate phosphatase KdsC-like HAD superfamily phosphatase